MIHVPDDALAAERLSRAWDGLIAGQEPAHDASGRVRFIRELRESGPAAPSRTARARIWQAALARSVEEGTTMADTHLLMPSMASPVPIEAARKRVRAWRPALEFAVAAALILAVIGGYVASDRIRSGDGDGGDGQFAAIASPEAASTIPPLGGGGASMSIPESQSEADGPLALSMWRLTVEPGTEWTTPDGSVAHLRAVQGVVGVRPVPMQTWDRLGRNSSYGADSSLMLRNQGSKPTVVDLFLLGYGDDVSNPPFPDGISAKELAGGFAMPLDRGEAFLSNETVQLIGGDDGVATIERDTGRDGAAVIVVEQGEIKLTAVAGTAVTRPRGDDGALLPVDGSIPTGSAVTMLAGDSAVINSGAAFRLESSETSVVTLVTIEQNTARAQGMQSRGKEPIVRSGDTVGNVETAPSPVPEDIPSPEECTVEPRPIETLESLAATPFAGTPEAFQFRPGDGEPADAETVQAITATLREVAACYNAGDALRVYALYTDAALHPALQPGDVERARRGEPLDNSLSRPMPLVWDVRVQPDGRVTAKVDFNHELALLVFVRSDDGARWLIDLFNDQVSFEDAPESTPQP